jgi:hypothetical protein
MLDDQELGQKIRQACVDLIQSQIRFIRANVDIQVSDIEIPEPQIWSDFGQINVDAKEICVSGSTIHIKLPIIKYKLK